jgi:hypothetical protein
MKLSAVQAGPIGVTRRRRPTRRRGGQRKLSAPVRAKLGQYSAIERLSKPTIAKSGDNYAGCIKMNAPECISPGLGLRVNAMRATIRLPIVLTRSTLMVLEVVIILFIATRAGELHRAPLQ